MNNGQPSKTTRGNASPTEKSKPIPQLLRVIKFLNRHHRSDTVFELDYTRTINGCHTIISHGIIVEAFQIRGQFEHLSRSWRRHIFDCATDTCDRAMPEVYRDHCSPGGHLANGFRSQRSGKGAQFGRNGIAPPDPHFVVERCDAIDERKGTKMQPHAQVERAAAARCWRITILQNVSVVSKRGISETFSGGLNRS